MPVAPVDFISLNSAGSLISSPINPEISLTRGPLGRLHRALLQILVDVNRVKAELTADSGVRELLCLDDVVNGTDADLQDVRNFLDIEQTRECDERRCCWWCLDLCHRY